MPRRELTVTRRGLVAGAAAGALGLVAAGCGSSVGLGSGGGAVAASGSSGSGMGSMGMGSGSSASAGSVSGSGSSMDAMAGMELKASGGAVDGIKPVPTQTLGTAEWEHMKILATAMTPVPFVVFNGTEEQTLTPPTGSSFHLMVNLDDARTGVPIPYATVWARISRGGKLVYNERQYPMISEYMGPHYGDNVVLPGAGRYQLNVLVTPPIAARHIEYKRIWLKPHTVNMTFDWTPPT